MATLASFLSQPKVITLPVVYTTAWLVSQATGGEVTVEEVLAEWIQQARDEIDRRAGMCFTAREKTEFIDGNGLDTIFTYNFPLVEMLKVIEDGEELPKSKYKVNLRTGSIKKKRGKWSPGIENIELRYIFGSRAVPPIVQKIATLLVAKTALSAKNGNLIDSESIGGFSQTRTFKKLNDELDRAWEAMGRRFPIHLV